MESTVCALLSCRAWRSRLGNTDIRDQSDVRAVLVAGVGFFLDSYDIFAINLITTLLGLVFWGGGDPSDGYGGNNGLLPDPVNQALKASTSSGIIIGQILFGWMAE